MQKRKVQFIVPDKSSKESDLILSEGNYFQEYNTEHLKQFNSPCPLQSFTDIETHLEPKSNFLIDDEEIDLDDNGESIASKREMKDKFFKFDCFLIKNRDKIEEQSSEAIENSPIHNNYKNAEKSTMQLQEPISSPRNRTFQSLNTIRIDFGKILTTPAQAEQYFKLQTDRKINENDQCLISYNNQDRLYSPRQEMMSPLNSMNSGHIIIREEKKNFTLMCEDERRRKKAVTLGMMEGVDSGFGFNEKIQRLANQKQNVQDVILRLSIRSSLMVYKFLRTLKRRIRLGGLSELTQNQLLIINDLSFVKNNDIKQRRVSKRIKFLIENRLIMMVRYSFNQFTKQMSLILSWINESPPIDPTSNWLLLWLIIQFMFIVLAVFYTPLELINGDTFAQKYGGLWVAYKFILTLAFILDIIIKFNTGLFEKGQIVLNRHEILRSYFKGGLLYDVLALFPMIQTVMQINYLQPINLLILLKVHTAKKALQQISDMISMRNSRIQNALSLFQLLLMIFSVCHIFACLFQGIAFLEEAYSLTKNTWMIQQKIADDSIHWIVKYNSALYFAVTTMITVGYGDIIPVTPYETCFVTIAMFVSCGVFAYSFNQIGDLVREQNRMSNEFKNQMVLVNRLLEMKKINRDLQIQVRKFLEFRYYAEPQLSIEEESMVMSKLSHHLREKVILEANLQIINHCSLLTKNFSKKFLESIAIKITVIYF